MERLTNNELMNIQGGGVAWGIFAAALSGVVFIIGVVDGYLRPYKCR